MPNKNIAPFTLILVVTFIGMLAPFTIDTYLPSFPSIEKEFDISRALLTQTLAIYLVSFAFATLIWGPLCDRFGRQPITIVSLGSYLLASLLCALAPNYETLMLGRALQGATVAGSMVASRAMIRDFFSSAKAQKAMSVNMMLFSAAPAVAPILGGWLEVYFGWRSIFYLLALYVLILGWVYLTRIGETQDPNHKQSIQPKAITQGYWEAIRHPKFLKIVVAQGALIGGFFIYIAGSTSIVFDHLNLTANQFGYFFVPLVVGVLLGAFASHRLTCKISSSNMIHLALFIAFTSVAANLLINILHPEKLIPIWLVILPMAIYAFAFSLANPALSIQGLDCLPHKRGLASGLQSLFAMGSAGLSAAIIVPLAHESLMHLAIAQSLVLLFAITLWILHQTSPNLATNES